MSIRFSTVFFCLSFLVFRIQAIAEPLDPLERDVYLMGTTFRVVLYEENKDKGISDLEAIIQTVEQTENQLSTWIPNSELSRLNDFPAARQFAMSPSLCSLWPKLELWVSQTNGSFDPSVGNLAAVWGIHGSFRIPEKTEISGALENTGFQYLKRNGCILIKTKAIRIDPGAFGKGEAMDRAIEVAEKRKMAALLIDFGGQLAVRGIPPQHEGWSSSLANPIFRTQESAVKVVLKQGSISTSGGSERDGNIDGKRIGHHLDPKTGYPVDFFGSVAVWRMKALEADMLSTALYVMGPDKGYHWAVQRGLAACFLISKEGKIQIISTPAFDSLTTN